MIKIIRCASLVMCCVSLSACMIDGTSSHNSFDGTSQQPGTMLYPEGYEGYTQTHAGYDLPDDGATAYQPSTHHVVVPASYHVGAISNPISPQDSDQSWVAQQNPQHYTIELAANDKASVVASTLAQAPKTARTAEIQDRSEYKGFYGSYTNKEAALEAYEHLPDALKTQAKIETWADVQR